MTTYPTIQTREATESASRPLRRTLPAAARVSMGLVFSVFGTIGILSFAGLIPVSRPSTPPPEAAAAFTAALMSAGYMFPMVKATELVVGLLLLTNRFVPLALAMIAPIVVNIVAFHTFLAPSGIGIAAAVLALEVYLAWTYREAYRPMLAMRTKAN
jgi:hypothetical protein